MNAKSWMTLLSWGCLAAGCSQADTASSTNGDVSDTPMTADEPAVNEPSAHPENPIAVEHGPVSGQSGSEVIEATPAVQEYLDCPCERLQGATTYVGTVISWESTLLTLQVSGIAPEGGGPDATGVGDIVKGIFNGQMPCYGGDYLPSPGDLVVAFELLDEAMPRFCCAMSECAEQCSFEGGSDTCLSDCQALATAVCDEERAEAANAWVVAPLEASGTVTLASDDDEVFSVSLEDLPTVFQGGEQCNSSLGSANEALEALGGPLPWAESCSVD